MKVLIPLLFLVSSSLFASSTCQYKEDSAKVFWTAYKSAKNIPVRGELRGVQIKAGSGKTIPTILKGSSFTIDIKRKTVYSKNVVRDSKITKYFFGNLLNGPKISGIVKDADDKTISTDLTFNGKTLPVELTYTIDKGNIVAIGEIELLSQFMAQASYNAIAKACAAKHEGKTGTKVTIELQASFTGC